MSLMFDWSISKSDMSEVKETCTVYDVAPAEECQTKIGLNRETPVAPFEGERSIGAGGGTKDTVVNANVLENDPLPAAFAPLTRQ